MLRRNQDSLLILPDHVQARPSEPLVSHLLEGSDVDLLVVAGEQRAERHAERLASRFPGRVSVFHCPDAEDCGRVLRWSFRYALSGGYRAVFLLDPRRVPDLAQLSTMRRALDHADVVVASRFAEPTGAVRSRLKRLCVAASCLLVGLPIVDLTSPCKGFGREVLESMKLQRFHSRSLAFHIELTHGCSRRGFRIAEVPASKHESPRRPRGTSWATLAEAFGLLVRLAARSRRSRRFQVLQGRAR